MQIANHKSHIVGILVAIGVMFMPFTVLAVGPGGTCTTGGTECTTGACARSGCFCSGTILVPTGTCEPRHTAGGFCTDNSQCQTSLRCNLSGSSGTCAAPADAAPTIYCWCKKTDGTCENHRLNDAPAGSRNALQCGGGGGSALDGTSAADTLSCSAYCTYRGMRAVHCETTFRPYNTSDTTADEANRCTPSAAPAAGGETSATPTGMGDGGEDRTSPSDFGLHNPIGSTDLRVIISRLIRAVLGVVGALFLVMFVYGGVQWMTAGESKRIDSAKKTLVNAVIGMIIIAFSYSIVSLVFSLAGQVAGGA